MIMKVYLDGVEHEVDYLAVGLDDDSFLRITAHSESYREPHNAIKVETSGMKINSIDSTSSRARVRFERGES
jgi:hypothetical protein